MYKKKLAQIPNYNRAFKTLFPTCISVKLKKNNPQQAHHLSLQNK